eukprot:TRINITY_DN308_c0_g4_i2.p1 TRINITY_DN308_c0_g4~~TRINITY_DN308_c0_g4_i2.p1  ORF type:complete len:230 (-),score=36.50 TRINITY_DN308_c0_g4_i2:13-702(-)
MCIRDRYVGISKVCADSLEKSSGRNVIPIRNSVDINKFVGLKRVRGACDFYNILMVGRITEDKDYLVMIEAISNLPEPILNRININIAGEGSKLYKEQLVSLIELKKINGKINFLGNHNNIPKLMNESDIFLMTSQNEGLPIALVESIASGLPSIVTNVGGCAEIVNAANCGIVVEPKSAVEITKAIIRLVENTKLLCEFSSNALKHAKEFDVEINKKKYVKLYSSLIK